MDQTYYGHTYINQFFLYQFHYLRGGPFIGKCICEFVGFLIFFYSVLLTRTQNFMVESLFFFFGILFSSYRCFISFSIFDFRFFDFFVVWFTILTNFCLQCFHHLSVLAKECWCTATCCVYSVFLVTLSRYLVIYNSKFISLCIKVLFSLLLPLEMTSFGLVLFRWTEYLGLGKAKAKVPHHFQSILEARVSLHFVPGSSQGWASPSLCLEFLLGYKVSLL